MISWILSPAGITTSIPKNSIFAFTVWPGPKTSPSLPPAWNRKSITACPRWIPLLASTISTPICPEIPGTGNTEVVASMWRVGVPIIRVSFSNWEDEITNWEVEVTNVPPLTTSNWSNPNSNHSTSKGGYCPSTRQPPMLSWISACSAGCGPLLYK